MKNYFRICSSVVHSNFGWFPPMKIWTGIYYLHHDVAAWKSFRSPLRCIASTPFEAEAWHRASLLPANSSMVNHKIMILKISDYRAEHRSTVALHEPNLGCGTRRSTCRKSGYNSFPGLWRPAWRSCSVTEPLSKITNSRDGTAAQYPQSNQLPPQKLSWE